MSRARFSKHVVGPIDCFLMIVVQQHNPYVPGALKGATWERVLTAFNELGSESFPEWQPFDRAQTIQDRSAMLMVRAHCYDGCRHGDGTTGTTTTVHCIVLPCIVPHLFILTRATVTSPGI